MALRKSLPVKFSHFARRTTANRPRRRARGLCCDSLSPDQNTVEPRCFIAIHATECHMTSDVTWETPAVEEIQCGMEVTAYAPAVEVAPAADDADR